MRRIEFVKCAIAGGAALLLCVAAVQAKPLQIRIGYVAAPPELPPVLFEAKVPHPHMGKNFTLKAIHFSGTPAMITAIAANEIDIGALSFSAFAAAVTNGRMNDLRVIADEVQDGVGGHFTGPFLVRKDSNIRSIADLKGKVLAVNAIGAYPDVAMTVMLRRHHIGPSEYTVVEARLPAMKAMLAEKKADMVLTAPVFTYDPGLEKISRPLFTIKQAMEGPVQMESLVARAGFIAKHRAALVDYFEDALRAARWFHNPANHNAVVQIFSHFTHVPAKRFQGWLFTKKDFYFDPNGIPNLVNLQKNIDLAHKMGVLKAAVNVKAHSDLSLVKEAGARLRK